MEVKSTSHMEQSSPVPEGDQIGCASSQAAEFAAKMKYLIDEALRVSGTQVPRSGSPRTKCPPEAMLFFARQDIQKWLLNAPSFWYEHGLSADEALDCINQDLRWLTPLRPCPLPPVDGVVSRSALAGHRSTSEKQVRGAEKNRKLTRIPTKGRAAWYEWSGAYAWLFGSRDIAGDAMLREAKVLWRLLFIDADYDDIARIEITEELESRASQNACLPPSAEPPPKALLELLATLAPHEIRHLQANLIAWYIALHGDIKPRSDSPKSKTGTRYRVDPPRKEAAPPRAAMSQWAARQAKSADEALRLLDSVTPWLNCTRCGYRARFVSPDKAQKFVDLEEADGNPAPTRDDAVNSEVHHLLFSHRCPRCGKERLVTSQDMSMCNKDAMHLFKVLNGKLPPEQQLSPRVHAEFCQHHRLGFRAHAGVFAEPRIPCIAQAMRRNENSVGSSLSRIYHRLGNGDTGFGYAHWVNFYVNPLSFTMWFLETSGLKSLRHVFPSLVEAWVCRFLAKCSRGRMDWHAMEGHSSSASLEALFNEAHPPEELGIKDIRDPLWTPSR